MRTLTQRSVAATLAALMIGFSTSAIADNGRNGERDKDESVRGPVRNTLYGKVRGTAVGNTAVFKGVPFAASTAGQNRWKPPQLATRWSGVRNSLDPGSVCPQRTNFGSGPAVGDEDCLNLNIWAPKQLPKKKLPVMVYIYGGGNLRGDANKSLFGVNFDGQYWVEQHETIVVTFNYRMATLGWLAHPGLTAESPLHVSGNYGILDQAAALAWVKLNISNFGGNPRKVMVANVSSSAQNAMIHLTAPYGRYLFDRMVIDDASLLADALPTLAAHEVNAGTTVANALGCGAAADQVACMRAVPLADLMRLFPGTPAISTPNVDGVFVTDQPKAILAEGKHAPVPILFTNATNGAVPLNFTPGTIPDEAAYVSWARTTFGPTLGDQVLALYPSSAYSSPENAAIAATSDRLYNCPSRRWARLAATAGLAKVYRGLQNHTHANGPSVVLGPYHASDVHFLFRNFDNNLFLGSPYTPTAAELKLSARMIRYWARFAATGNPNGGGATSWPEFEDNAENHLLLDIPFVAGTNFHAAGCDLWDANT